ncbi:hypothetical protein M9H77_15304 [Catharanthus roseus]|uniref:Uncharacterized protein n=1 Tax=Catharanthus roseus TaxID=4058 RepID=A0ACC0AXW2_CATRO|nr:hypothetical protein M9H77_15304 [Catharanthus roseus]
MVTQRSCRLKARTWCTQGITSHIGEIEIPTLSLPRFEPWLFGPTVQSQNQLSYAHAGQKLDILLLEEDKKKMMKDLILVHQQQQSVLEENMSNLTSASNEASASSSVNRNDSGNGRFQRDQNLQLHRRGHNLPWKLKQRTSKEIRKKVYVCPETSCVHHDPSRALGDLTGIKKHFCRKHGEKKWKCEKCSKRYAVQSDWKAHSKTCGTREYRCDCGTLFSRRDSFITHRAFCDALAEESARTISGNPLLSSQSAIAMAPSSSSSSASQFIFSMKKEQQTFNLRPEIPPWLACPNRNPNPNSGPGPGPPSMELTNSSSIFSTENQDLGIHHNPNPSLGSGPTTLPPPPYHNNIPTTSSPYISATALLQKAAQMGSTSSSSPAAMLSRGGGGGGGPHQTHVSTDSSSVVLNLSSRSTAFEDALKDDIIGFHDALFSKAPPPNHREEGGGGHGGGGGGNDGMTRDFLGLRPLSHHDIFNIAGLGNCMNTHQNTNQRSSWQDGVKSKFDWDRRMMRGPSVYNSISFKSHQLILEGSEGTGPSNSSTRLACDIKPFLK